MSRAKKIIIGCVVAFVLFFAAVIIFANVTAKPVTVDSIRDGLSGHRFKADTFKDVSEIAFSGDSVTLVSPSGREAKTTYTLKANDGDVDIVIKVPGGLDVTCDISPYGDGQYKLSPTEKNHKGRKKYKDILLTPK